jgi:CubicO group peptidase (beta-lactamase class C family)
VKQLSIVPARAALAAALAFAAAPLAAQTRDSARVAAVVDSVASAAVAGGQAAGLSVAVSVDRRPVLVKGYGYAELGWQIPTPPRAVYQIGSVTKQFTAAAIMQLVEQGKVDLDADVTKYVPDLDTQGRRVSVRRLLDHTSGIRSYTDMPEFREFDGKTLPRDTLIRLVSKQPFRFEPGAMEMYNNSGFFLLGLIIEKVSGTSYADYVKANLFDRAGMKDSRYCDESEVVAGMTRGYDHGPQGLRHARTINNTWPYAAGSLCATVADLDAWNQALHGGRILGAAAYREMVTPGRLRDGTPLRYAKGIAASEIAGHRAYHHGGDIDGFATYLAYFPEERVSIAVAVNSQGPVRPYAIIDAVAQVVYGKPAKEPEFKGKVADYVGEYRGGSGFGDDLVVKVLADSAGRLAMQGPLVRPDDPNGGRLTYLGGLTFQLDDKQLTFVRENGRVAALHVDAVYAFLPLKRQPDAAARPRAGRAGGPGSR